MAGDGQYYQGKVTNICYKCLIVFGGGGGVHVLTKERHHLYGVWTKLVSMSRLLQFIICLWGPHKNDYIFFRPSTLPAAMYGDPVLNHQI